MYEKVCKYISNPEDISLVPGNKDARMIKDHHSNRPHFVAPGRGKGQFVCDSTCPGFLAHKMCSHYIATAHATGHVTLQLRIYLTFLCNSKSRKKNYTNCAKTDMPKFPQKKGRVGPTKQKKMPAVMAHTERQYTTAQISVKKNNCINVCFISLLYSHQ
jgi:hypothetical protein